MYKNIYLLFHIFKHFTCIYIYYYTVLKAKLLIDIFKGSVRAYNTLLYFTHKKNLVY